MKKTDKKKLPVISDKLHKQMTQEGFKSLWGEVNLLKDVVANHSAKIHNLSGDCDVLLERTRRDKPAATGLKKEIFNSYALLTAVLVGVIVTLVVR